MGTRLCGYVTSAAPGGVSGELGMFVVGVTKAMTGENVAIFQPIDPCSVPRMRTSCPADGDAHSHKEHRLKINPRAAGGA